MTSWEVFWIAVSASALMFLAGTGYGFYTGYKQGTADLVGKMNERLNENEVDS